MKNTNSFSKLRISTQSILSGKRNTGVSRVKVDKSQSTKKKLGKSWIVSIKKLRKIIDKNPALKILEDARIEDMNRKASSGGFKIELKTKY